MAQPYFKSKSAYVSQVGRENRVIVSWEVESHGQDLSALEVVVFRGESPANLQPIAGPLNAARASSFVDATGKMLDLHRVYYYRLVLRPVPRVDGRPAVSADPLGRPQGDTVISVHRTDVDLDPLDDAVFTWEGGRDLIGEFVIGEHNFKFRYAGGVPVAIFQRRREAGVRCHSCWDPVTRSVTKSNCTVCFGTGWIEGYYDPIYAWADLSPNQKLVKVLEWGEKQPSQIDIMFSDYPRLRPGDVFAELTTPRRLKVMTTQQTERRRTPMLQFVRVDVINPSDVEHRVEIPRAMIERAEQELREIRQNKLVL